jgi:endo-1,4-beta-mannosidase
MTTDNFEVMSSLQKRHGAMLSPAMRSILLRIACSLTRWFTCLVLFAPSCLPFATSADEPGINRLPKIRLTADGQSFVAGDGGRYVPFGVNYYRPGTGWAPQVWKQFDPVATRRDFARMKELNLNCVRVFLTFGSFYNEPGKLDPNGLAKLDQFLDLAEAAGIYVHPTGPDHWEGLPEWARGDRIADDHVLEALESFWKQLAARYRGRSAVFAYDLLNEPEVRWDSPSLRKKWRAWVTRRYATPAEAAAAWRQSVESVPFNAPPIPGRDDAPGNPLLLDYQRFREEIADEWTRRQAQAIKSVDPDALVTVGLIQWSVPVLLAAPWQYSGFRPDRQAQHLDFLEIHFYPLDHGAYQYASDESEARNLAYLESVVREVARPGKAVVIAEFGWYGGAKPTFDGGRHPAATEEQQARWCRRAVEATAGLATGWLNWGFHDHPESHDVSQLTGLLKADGSIKAWGREFSALSRRLGGMSMDSKTPGHRPTLDWEEAIISTTAGHAFRERYYQAYRADQ